MIHSLLLNPAYAGKAIYGRRRSVPWRAPLRPPRGHDGLPKRSWRQIPADPDQYITVPVPAIIDDDLFTRAAEQLEENRQRNRERLSGVHYLLSGLLVCLKCGYSFTGHHHRAQWRYYRCCGTDRSRFDGQLRCTARLVAAEGTVNLASDGCRGEPRRGMERHDDAFLSPLFRLPQPRRGSS